MNPDVFWKPRVAFKLIPMFVTEAVNDALNERTITDLIGKAEEARNRRGINIRESQMYYIRLMVPPSERLVTIMFLWIRERVEGYVAYHDEIEHLLTNAGPDIKKLPGSPF